MFSFTFTACSKNDCNIVDYGAVADGKTNNAISIQKAIDEASANGGGKVVVPQGVFVSGALFLKSNVELHLEEGSVLQGSISRSDYGNDSAYAFISGTHVENIIVSGEGVIDGRGNEVIKNLYGLLRAGILADDKFDIKRPREKSRPELLAFSQCHNIQVNDIVLKNSAAWVLTFRNSEIITIDGITIESSVYWNNDGIDVVNSKEVYISNCRIDCADDGICLKSEGEILGICENVTVENCTLRTSASGFKMGTGSHGGFKNIKVRNLTIYDTYRSAIAIECVDGAVLENVDVRDIRAIHTGNAFLIRLGHRNVEGEPGILRNVYIGNLYAEIPSGKPDIGYPFEGPRKKYPHNVFPASITGFPGNKVEDIRLENIEVVYEGGGTKETAFFDWQKLDDVPEESSGYPEFSMFGELPCWALYVRHASNLSLKNVRFGLKSKDYRPACIFDDVENMKIDSLSIDSTSAMPVIVYKDIINLEQKKLNLPAGNNGGIVTWE